jgi:hypothetical protein
MITAEAPQPQIISPTPEEIAEAIAAINGNATSTVYESRPGQNPEAISTEEVEHRVGSLATGEAVGMASLPEEFGDQQLHKFNFTVDEYAAHRAYQADAFHQIEKNLKKVTSEDENEEDEENTSL